MRTLTYKDILEMKRMGYTVRVWYKTKRGVPFHKDFTTGEEEEKFTAKAQEVGTQLIGFASI